MIECDGCFKIGTACKGYDADTIIGSGEDEILDRFLGRAHP